ncbi:MAG: hypothetical protein NTNFB01_16830 [Nitrospira sp.]
MSSAARLDGRNKPASGKRICFFESRGIVHHRGAGWRHDSPSLLADWAYRSMIPLVGGYE